MITVYHNKMEIVQDYTIKFSYYYDNLPSTPHTRTETVYNKTHSSALWYIKSHWTNVTILEVNGISLNDSFKDQIWRSRGALAIFGTMKYKQSEWEVTVKFYFNIPSSITTRTVTVDADDETMALEKASKQFPNIQDINAKEI